jgi:hypothetical protein
MINTIKITGTIIHNISISFKDVTQPQVEAHGDLREYTTYTKDQTLYINTIDDSKKVHYGKGPVVEVLTIQLPKTYKGSLYSESLDSTITIPNIEDHFTMINIEGLRNVLNISNGSTSVNVEGLNTKVYSNNVSGFLDVDGLNSKITIYDNLNISVEFDGLSSRLHHNDITKKSTFGEMSYQNRFIEGRKHLKVTCDGLKSSINIVKG